MSRQSGIERMHQIVRGLPKMYTDERCHLTEQFRLEAGVAVQLLAQRDKDGRPEPVLLLMSNMSGIAYQINTALRSVVDKFIDNTFEEIVYKQPRRIGDERLINPDELLVREPGHDQRSGGLVVKLRTSTLDEVEMFLRASEDMRREI